MEGLGGGKGGRKEKGGQEGRGSDGVKRTRADLGTSGSEGREAAAAQGKRGHNRAGGSADGAGGPRKTWTKVETMGWKVTASNQARVQQPAQHMSKFGIA